MIHSTSACVAIVDDDAMVSASLTAILSREGYRVESFSSPVHALEFLKQNDVDAVLSDVSMPTMTGIELLARLRDMATDTPIVLMTGVPRIEDTIRALELGAFRYLTKPLAGGVVRKAIHEAVHWRRLTRASTAGPALADRAELEEAFNRALERISMAYQPIVSATSKLALGHEALMRSSEAKLPSPPAVLDAAEKLGRLHALGRKLRRIVAQQLTSRPDQTMFVNLHSADLADRDLTDPKAPLTTHARSVVLELTERASLESISSLEMRLATLRELGFRIAVDDLGAGYAGLSYFARLSPDIVKIDMSLTRNIHKDNVKQRVFGSICRLAQDLDILVVAEGIETEEELVTVNRLGADLVQGYLTGRPGPLPPPTIE